MNEIAWRDVLFSALLGATFLFVAMMASVTLKAVEKIQHSSPPGNLMVMITWPEGPDDVDLWVDGPRELRPVGYSDKSGVEWNLLRDDRGRVGDVTPLNYENAYTRGYSAGEYVVDVHAFSTPVVPVTVTVEVSMNRGNGKGSTTVLFETKVTLDHEGQELTAVRFKLDERGRVVPGSVNHIFKPLRSSSE